MDVKAVLLTGSSIQAFKTPNQFYFTYLGWLKIEPVKTFY
jgi:hypothetical protein